MFHRWQSNWRFLCFKTPSNAIDWKCISFAGGATNLYIIFQRHWQFKGRMENLFFEHSPERYWSQQRSILNGPSSQSINKVFYSQLNFTCFVLSVKVKSCWNTYVTFQSIYKYLLAQKTVQTNSILSQRLCVMLLYSRQLIFILTLFWHSTLTSGFY